MILDRTHIAPGPLAVSGLRAFRKACEREFQDYRRAGHTLRFTRDPANDKPHALAVICYT